VNDLVYKHELEEWGKRTDMKLVTTVDPGGEKPGWTLRRPAAETMCLSLYRAQPQDD
jgi:NAD(P)H-flavin reductase